MPDTGAASPHFAPTATPVDAPSPTPDDDWAAALPGLSLQHDLHLTLADWADWDVINQRLHAIGGEIHALAMHRQEGLATVRARLKGPSVAAVRQLVESLAAEGRVRAVRAEHLMLAR